MITAEKWDWRWLIIRDGCLDIGHSDDVAADIADRETTEQFGARPAEETT